MGIAVVIISYFLGAVSFSTILTKWIAGVDIRSLGSGNAGATNTLRAIGVGPAVAVLVLDALKGVAAVLLGGALGGGNDWWAALAGLAVIVGHNWPVYYGFRGGKGVATTIGVMAAFDFWPVLLVGIVTIIVIAVTRYVSLGSMVFSALIFIVFLIQQQPAPIITCSLLAALLLYFKHRGNIYRLIQGNERKLGMK
jgi:glycerol-3-phosphate acyltransferase PlsY